MHVDTGRRAIASSAGDDDADSGPGCRHGCRVRDCAWLCDQHASDLADQFVHRQEMCSVSVLAMLMYPSDLMLLRLPRALGGEDTLA